MPIPIPAINMALLSEGHTFSGPEASPENQRSVASPCVPAHFVTASRLSG